jgi:hypothetical protein
MPTAFPLLASGLRLLSAHRTVHYFTLAKAYNWRRWGFAYNLRIQVKGPGRSYTAFSPDARESLRAHNISYTRLGVERSQVSVSDCQ